MNESKRLGKEERAELARYFVVFRNSGSVDTGLWMFAPHDADLTFELYSEGYRTRREAEWAAWKFWTGPALSGEEREAFEEAAEAAGR